MEVLYRLSYRGIFCVRGGGRIRTSVGEAGRFTVCSLWPLGHTPGHAPAALCRTPDYGSKHNRLFNGRTRVSARPPPEPGKGFEPPTGRLQGGCSTSELPGPAAAGGALHAGFARLRQLVSTFRPAASTLSTLRSFGPRFQQEPYETSSPARTRDCNSANPALTSPVFFAESGSVSRSVLSVAIGGAPAYLFQPMQSLQ